jgi:predicted small lipoprotein YifL
MVRSNSRRKKEAPMSRARFAFVLLALSLATGGLSACGVKGPLETVPAPADQQQDQERQPN